MEEMRKVAQAYYNNGSWEVQRRTLDFFESMDTDNDGKIQFHEFWELLYREGYIDPRMSHRLFSDLDVDRNGVLDFNEFLTLFYVIMTKNGFCCQCGRCLKGLYFTCITCFDSPTARTFDLCPDCYSVRNWTACHPHINFADNALLLRARRRCSINYDPNPSSSYAVELQQFMQPESRGQIQQVHSPQYQHCQGQPEPERDGMKMILRTLEIALAAGAIGGGAAFCSIM